MRQSKAIFHSILSYDDVYNTKEEEEEDHGISLSYWVTRLEQSNLFSLSTNITSLDANLKAFEYHDQLFLSVLAGMCLYPNIAISDPVYVSWMEVNHLEMSVVNLANMSITQWQSIMFCCILHGILLLSSVMYSVLNNLLVNNEVLFPLFES